MYQPGEKEYLELRSRYKSVPVSLEWPSDTDTPITLYAGLGEKRPSFLLESVEGGENLGRYSFIGTDPVIRITSRRGVTTVESDGARKDLPGDPFAVIGSVLKEFSAPPLEGMPRFFGGLVGYLGYDMVRHIERLPDCNREDAGLPDCMLMAPGILAVIDHVRHTVRAVAFSRPTGDPGADYKRSVEKLEEARARLTRGGVPARLSSPAPCLAGAARRTPGGRKFMDSVKIAREYILAGEALQVVLSRRIDLDFSGDPLTVYRRLRRSNPSPYLFHLDMGDLVMSGSSPEMLVRVEGGVVETRPIAGTRPRGSGRDEDVRLAGELLADPKERAEHLMLVDLGRNDLGRVSSPGSVQVPRFMEVEMYSHVMHLVSSVKGDLAGGLDALDALRSCFPAGTVSGAPKVRAMEIIEELEPSRRGPYAGAVGYLGFNGSLDMAIAIRTIVFHGKKASVQVGAGIVADSDPARELTETENKAGALLEALAGEVGQGECC